MEVAFINTKGFGGNNATGVVLAPKVVRRMLKSRHGDKALSDYEGRLVAVKQSAEAYDESALRGDFNIVYNFGQDMIDDHQLKLGEQEISIPGLDHSIQFAAETRYGDMVS